MKRNVQFSHCLLCFCLTDQMELLPSLGDFLLQPGEIMSEHHVSGVVLSEVPVHQGVIEEAIVRDGGVERVPLVVRVQRVTQPVPLTTVTWTEKLGFCMQENSTDNILMKPGLKKLVFRVANISIWWRG
jgi:hypothetical protein